MNDLHTAEIENVEVVGILFDPTEAQFYEFQDPDSHDRYEKLVCPRTGDEIVNRNRIEEMMGEIISGRIKATIPIEQWKEFREMYVEADEHDFDAWKSKWEDMQEADPRF